MKAKLRFHRKVLRVRPESRSIAVAELKIWDLPRPSSAETGIKFSLFLVDLRTGMVIVGFDNHRPKGPHLHHLGEERTYEFVSAERLVDDFWMLVEKEGFTE